jgi:hypothetical protein
MVLLFETRHVATRGMAARGPAFVSMTPRILVFRGLGVLSQLESVSRRGLASLDPVLVMVIVGRSHDLMLPGFRSRLVVLRRLTVRFEEIEPWSVEKMHVKSKDHLMGPLSRGRWLAE